MEGNGAFKHLFKVGPLLVRVEVIDDALELIWQVLVDHLMVLILADNYLEHTICLLVLNEDVPLCQIWLRVKHDERSFNRLLEANICRLEGHLRVFSRLCKILGRCLSLAFVDCAARSFHHLVELLDSHELASLFI